MEDLLVPLSLRHVDPELFEIWASVVINKAQMQIEQQREQRMQQAEQQATGAIPGAAGMPPVQGVPPGLVPAPLSTQPFNGIGTLRH